MLSSIVESSIDKRDIKEEALIPLIMVLIHFGHVTLYIKKKNKIQYSLHCKD
jgi:hypothetical protein